MNNYFTVLKALFKNKFRFADNATKSKKYGFIALIAVAYVAVMAILITGLVQFEPFANLPTFKLSIYFFGLLTGALVVLIFGVVNLVGTLYLSKDTDFYSMLPIKSSVVFAAKVTYVYLSEAIIVGVILLPLMITFGIISEAWIWFYPISILAILIVPALPLVLSAIVAVPVMFLASKLKNRSIISLIFYLVLFGGFFGVYIYFVYSATDIDSITEETLINLTNAISTVLYVFYPYTALAMAACEIPSYNLGLGASTVANLGIFVGASVVMMVIVLLLAKFMYSQAAKANNQTNSDKVKRGEFKSSSMTKSLMKREYVGTLRTTQIAFQCYATLILPAIFAIVLGIISKNWVKLFMDEGFSEAEMEMFIEFFKQFFGMMGISVIAMMISTLGNGAATSFSREGNAFATLKVLPCSAKQIVKAKALAWMSLAVPAALVAVVIFNALNFDLTTFLLSVFSLVPLAAAFVLFGALWDLSAPKLKWVDPMQAVKHNGHVAIGQFICMAGGIVALIVLIMITNAENINFDVLKAVFWSVIYITLIVFIIIDIVLLSKVEEYYNRIEI